MIGIVVQGALLIQEAMDFIFLEKYGQSFRILDAMQGGSGVGLIGSLLLQVSKKGPKGSKFSINAGRSLPGFAEVDHPGADQGRGGPLWPGSISFIAAGEISELFQISLVGRLGME